MKQQDNHCILHPHKLICYKCTWTSCSEVHVIPRHTNGWTVKFILQFHKACREKHRAYVHWYGILNLKCHLENNPHWTMLNHHIWFHANINLNPDPNLNLNPSFHYTQYCHQASDKGQVPHVKHLHKLTRVTRLFLQDQEKLTSSHCTIYSL